jgi:predicted nucleic acid-binding protein
VANRPNYVLDSFALLSYLEGEAGMIRVKSVLGDARKERCRVYISIINLGEVLYIVEREKGLAKAHETLAAIQQLPIDIFPAETQTVLDAAHIKANHTLSYADAFATACAQSVKGTVLTGDREFESVEQIINVEWLPGNSL